LQKVFKANLSAMNWKEKIFSKEFLEQQRTCCDPLADAYAQQIASEVPTAIAQLLTWLNNTQADCPQSVQPIVEKYFSEVQIPAWADRNRMLKANAFFSKHENLILYLLGVLSLPYCYAARNGVQVLFFSKRLEKDTFRRLQETALFVINANTYSIENETEWKKNILKIRLLHALMRIFVLKSNKWQDKWGKPINQEDMAGTNLSFSYIVLRGMRKLGFSFSAKEAEDFLHLWNVIGYLLGVQETLLPNTMQEAFWLDKQISEKEFAPSNEGKILCKALIATFTQQSPLPIFADFAIAQMRFLLGERVAQILDIPAKNISKIIPILTLSEQTASWLVPKANFRAEIAKAI